MNQSVIKYIPLREFSKNIHLEMKNKYTAAILAFFFGFLGVHRFYLKQYLLGVIYLIFFPIAAIISLIDTILFITEDQMEFDYRYNKDFFYSRYGRNLNEYKNDKKAQARGYFEDEIKKKKKKKKIKRKTIKRDNTKLELAKQYLENYDLDKALVTYLEVLKTAPEDPETHFALAQVYSLKEDAKQSLYHADMAIDNGKSINEIQLDEKLAYLRIQPEFDSLISQGSQNTPAQSKDFLAELEKLSKLRENGVLTETEFDIQKQKILNQG